MRGYEKRVKGKEDLRRGEGEGARKRRGRRVKVNVEVRGVNEEQELGQGVGRVG